MITSCVCIIEGTMDINMHFDLKLMKIQIDKIKL